MYVFLLIFLSVAPIVFFGYQIYKRDFDKEPTSTLVKLFLCGVGSIFVTLFLTSILCNLVPFFGYNTSNLNIIELIPYVFIGVALIEEFSKWIFVYKLEYNDQEFNHLYDGIVYAAFVSLGFACFENILYVMQYGVQTAISRAFLAIPGHLCDGIAMGYFLSMAKLSLINNNPSLSKKNIALSLLVPVAAHGLYDYLLFACDISKNNLFMLAFLGFVVFFFTYASKKVKQLSHNYYNLNPNYITKRQRDAMNNYQYQQQNMNYNGQYNYQQQGMNYNNQYNYPQQNMNYNNQYNYQQQGMNYNNQYNYQNNVAPRYCPNCGKQVVGNFCTNCGKSV